VTSAPRALLRITVLLVAGLLAAGFDGCSAGGRSTACQPVRSEILDRRSLIHVLPGAPTAVYLSNPPTSGPHQPSPPVHGVVGHRIDPAVQVGILEGGTVLVQYRGLSAPQQRALAALAGPKVVIAPNAGLPAGDTVVATAWLTKQECRTPDVATLRRFVTDHADKGPGTP
jgi:Protein of unknown function (DUF3105)